MRLHTRWAIMSKSASGFRINSVMTKARRETVRGEKRRFTARFFLFQKPQRQHGKCHVMIPAYPRTNFVVSHSHIAFGRLKTLLNTVSAASNLYQNRKRRVGGGEEILEFRLLGKSPGNQKNLMTLMLVIIVNRYDAHFYGLQVKWTPGCISNIENLPIFFRQAREPLFDFHWPGGEPSVIFRPDVQILRDLKQILFVPFYQTISPWPAAAELRIARYPGMRKNTGISAKQFIDDLCILHIWADKEKNRDNPVLFHTIFLLESVNTSACINKLLLTGKKRMAL